jgi:nucleoside-diphosphate-sugar epimerase
MPHTLITGPNGFLGATMVAAALSAGHKITGTVRNLKAGKDLLAVHPEWDHSLVDFVEVPDYTTEGVFDEIFKKGAFDYVLHTAAPVLDDPKNTDFERDFEKPSVAG